MSLVADIYISQGSVATRLRCGDVVRYLNMTMLYIYYWVMEWKNFENRLIFGEVTCKSIVSCFLLTHGVDKPSWVFAQKLPLTYPTLCFNDI